MTTRSLLKTLAMGALVASTALFGCKKEEPKPEPVAAAPAPAEPPKPEPLKAAWIYVGPVGDAGWSYAHDLGRKAVEAKFGDKVKTHFVESVPEGADSERVIRDLVAQGNKVIFATSFGYMDSMVKVAKDFPDVLVRARHRLPDRAQPARLRGALLRARLPGRHRGRRHDQDQHPRASWPRCPSPRCSATSTPSPWARRA